MTANMTVNQTREPCACCNEIANRLDDTNRRCRYCYYICSGGGQHVDPLKDWTEQEVAEHFGVSPDAARRILADTYGLD